MRVRVGVVAGGEVEVTSWWLRRSGRADLSVVDELARLQLAARRLGCTIRLSGADRDLVDLLGLAGLAGLLLEVGGEAEEGEQLGVEEGVEGGDPAA